MFADVDFQRRFELALGGTHRGAADAGEVLATATRITDGDPDSWLNAVSYTHLTLPTTPYV